MEGSADKRSNNTGYTAAVEKTAKENARIYSNPSRVIGVWQPGTTEVGCADVHEAEDIGYMS